MPVANKQTWASPPITTTFLFSRSARFQAGGDILINAADVGLGFGFLKAVVLG